MDELSRNGSGYYDPTASPVLHAIHKREQEADEDANRIIRLIKDLLRICDFELIERIQIRHKPTGREYRRTTKKRSSTFADIRQQSAGRK